jgi:Uncharacterized protein conserved in bacteria
MKTFIALLRGINVGGKNVIKMDALRKSFESIGLSDVKTYIQSGNVLFHSDDDEDCLKKKIESQIEKEFGLSLTVVLRTAEEIEQIVGNCPFSKEKVAEAEIGSDSECLYVALLTHIPKEENVQMWSAYGNDSNSDEFQIIGRDVFFLFRDSIRNSKLAMHLNKLDAAATVRNWKTLNKIATIAREL